MQFLYSALWWVLTPLVPYIWRHRERIGKEDRARRGERFGFPGQARPDGTLIWLHAASVGESLSLLALIDAFRLHYPDWRYLVTTGTVTSAKLMAGRLPKGTLHQFVPFDHPLWVQRFLRHWQPNGVLWVESEIWPSLINGIRERQVPAVLLNARMSDKSARRWKLTGAWGKKLLNTFQLIAAQTPDDGNRFRALTNSPVSELGNLKFVSNPLPVDEDARAQLQAQIGERPVWLMASTHAPEEEIAARAHAALKKEFPSLLTVIVPRHPIRGMEIASALRAYDTVSRRSLGEEPASIYVADTLGELGLFYSLIKPVVVGGSFTVGGHNPIEPAQLGCAVICGPLMYNFTAVMAAFDSASAMVHIADEVSLASHLASLLRDTALQAKLGEEAKRVCAVEGESLPRLWQALEPWRDAVSLTSPRTQGHHD